MTIKCSYFFVENFLKNNKILRMVMMIDFDRSNQIKFLCLQYDRFIVGKTRRTK